MPRLRHGSVIKLDGVLKAREERAARTADVPLSFALSKPVDLQDFDFMFPKLQHRPNNLLPESQATRDGLIAMSSARSGVSALPMMTMTADPLSVLAQGSRLRSHSILLWEQVSSEPLRFPGSTQTAIHVVLEGSAFVHLAGTGSVPIDEGQFFWLPKDQPHIVSSGPIAGEPVPIERTLQRPITTSSASPIDNVRYIPAPRAPTATILTLSFRGLVSDQASLFESWPSYLMLGSDGAPLQSLAQTISMMVRARRPGDQLACSRLAEGLLMMVLEQAATRFSGSAETLGALSDAGLQRALLSVREDIARPWTVQSLARKAGMSRTLFARRFRDAVGVTVADHLRTQRIRRAQELLGHHATSLKAVCIEVGFSSVSSFSRAFLEIVGVRPGEFAHTHAGSTRRAHRSSVARGTPHHPPSP